MAIIKCPECGHLISDKAPTCPCCGVEICGKVTRCPECGQECFKADGVCPHCHHPLQERQSTGQPAEQSAQQQPTQQQSAQQQPTEQKQQEEVKKAAQPVVNPTLQQAPQRQAGTIPPPPPVTPSRPETNSGNDKKSNKTAIIIGVIIAILICGVVGYLYKDAQEGQEAEDYEYAMNSSDSLVLKSYLDKYPDAPEAHIDSINAHLQMMRMGDQEWTNTLISNSRSALEAYLEKHPDTPHKAEILHRIDSIDWQQASSTNTLDAYQEYLSAHANGEHVDEANTSIKQIKTKTVSPTEQQMVQGVIRQFFQSLNSKNEGGLTATLEGTITSFLGKQNATQADAVEFMNRLYKENVASMLWKVNGFKITKKEVGDEEYEYTVAFTAVQTVKHNDQEAETINTYKVNAKVSPEDLISMLSMTKILE